MTPWYRRTEKKAPKGNHQLEEGDGQPEPREEESFEGFEEPAKHQQRTGYI